MKILHVCATDVSGGAARAAYRVHRALVDHGGELGVESCMRAIHKFTNDDTVLGGPPAGQSGLWKRLHPRLNLFAKRGFNTGNPVSHSIAWPGTGLGKELEQLRRQEADLITLHWLGDSTLSIEEIGRLPQPLVWRLPDQWAFLGAEHYTTPPATGETASTDERFAYGYSEETRPAHESGTDLNRRTWLRKQRAWHRPIQIVAPTTWIADLARRSTLMANWPISVIPTPIDLIKWAPVEKDLARKILNIPPDQPLVLFGAMGGTADPRKGADLLLEALHHLWREQAGSLLEHLELMVFGMSRPEKSPYFGFPIHYKGKLNDDLSLRILYAAADVFVIPSIQDNLPGTGIEAHACGTPVIAFRTGGLVDIVDDHITGALADPFDPLSLAAAIRWVLEDPQRLHQLGVAARQRAERLWDPARVAGLYADVYGQAIAANGTSVRG